MGLFGKLFDKKECDICGGEIGLLGNRKLDDGNLCKNCAAKLSPFFSDRRHSTVEQIREQLDYREANKQAVASFHTTRTLGTYTKIHIDEDNRKFMVTSARDLAEANPDVLDYADVTGCRLDIKEDRDELKQKDKDGNEVSFNPPRYEYGYDFYIIINVNNPYFDEIRFRLNSSTVKVTPPVAAPAAGGKGLAGILNAAAGVLNNTDPRLLSVDYREYQKMGNDIVEILTGVRQQIRDEIDEAAAPKAAVICPYCKATTVPNEKGCCEYCGSPLGA